jgi:large subunit ribosomal protein L20
MKLAKGFWGDRKNHLRLTTDAVAKALSDNYKHRKLRKRDFRSLWVTRMSAAAKVNGLSYCSLIDALKKAGCRLNRKMLSEKVFRCCVTVQFLRDCKEMTYTSWVSEAVEMSRIVTSP